MVKLKIVTTSNGAHLETEDGQPVENAIVHIAAAPNFPETTTQLANVSLVNAEMEMRVTGGLVVPGGYQTKN